MCVIIHILHLMSIVNIYRADVTRIWAKYNMYEGARWPNELGSYTRFRRKPPTLTEYLETTNIHMLFFSVSIRYIHIALIYCGLRHFQQYFSYVMASSFSGGGSRRLCVIPCYNKPDIQDITEIPYMVLTLISGWQQVSSFYYNNP
jgi:hypothetical protein